MTKIQSKEFTVKRNSIITLVPGAKVIALVAPDQYVVKRDLSRNKAFPDAIGYVVEHADPIRNQEEGALYYVDYHPSEGTFIFCQGRTLINFRTVYRA